MAPTGSEKPCIAQFSTGWASIQRASAQFRVIVIVVVALQNLRVEPPFGPPIGLPL
jgi:hypothetical protein